MVVKTISVNYKSSRISNEKKKLTLMARKGHRIGLNMGGRIYT
tara:strand:+ start:277 stop:405 length:129 start_codon:yes stop_codon:yes gene_type:complete